MRRRASALIAVAALAAGGAGLVMAQDQPQAPPAVASGGSADATASTVQTGGSESANTTGDAASLASAPPDEAAPPPPVALHEAQAPPEPPAEPTSPPPPPQPLPRPRFTTAVLQATDKVTAETLRFEARVGEAVRYKGLVITPRACEATADDESQVDAFGYLDVTSQPSPIPGRPTPAPHEVFHGWMSANSPSLNPLPSPGYDVWVIACRTPAPPAPGGHA